MSTIIPAVSDVDFIRKKLKELEAEKDLAKKSQPETNGVDIDKSSPKTDEKPPVVYGYNYGCF